MKNAWGKLASGEAQHLARIGGGRAVAEGRLRAGCPGTPAAIIQIFIYNNFLFITAPQAAPQVAPQRGEPRRKAGSAQAASVREGVVCVFGPPAASGPRPRRHLQGIRRGPPAQPARHKSRTAGPPPRPSRLPRQSRVCSLVPSSRTEMTSGWRARVQREAFGVLGGGRQVARRMEARDFARSSTTV